MNAKPKKREPFRTQAFNLGPLLTNIDIDNVAEAIAHAEGEGYRVLLVDFNVLLYSRPRNFTP